MMDGQAGHLFSIATSIPDPYHRPSFSSSDNDPILVCTAGVKSSRSLPQMVDKGPPTPRWKPPVFPLCVCLVEKPFGRPPVMEMDNITCEIKQGELLKR